MGFLKSLGETPHLYDVMNISPRMAVYLFKMTDEIMLVEGPLNDKERELIAAYVSGLNACSFCYRGHKAIAEMFGVEEGLIDELVEDLESVEIDGKIKAALRYSKKVTENASKLVAGDADALYAAGWDENALMNIVEICALFAMYNRLADGTGVIAGNTKTTLTSNKKHGAYIDNLVDFGIDVPEDMKVIIDL
ncbi:MAG: peroxidase-related enzyme [Rhodospirillaceae bacterium]|nr:peroxidase-related enzyme [Rhodospirillaceae bacterium]MBT7276901.1 peroxidase-related enzyme [Woeseiaceae bacterium]